jgi:hypothetical protein
MRKSIIAACAGMLAACSLPVQPPAPRQWQAETPAALADEGRYAEAIALLEKGAQRQDRTWREAAAKPAAAAATGLWPAGMARVEVRQVGAGMVEVVRVEGGVKTPAVERKREAPRLRPAVAMRIEVSNGNGVPGMAAAVARSLRAEGMQVVRLTNTIPFNVEKTRIEIRGSAEPHMRIVLGKDLEIKKPPAGGRRQAP